MFIDQAEIHLKAGRGGNGCRSFRRELFVPKGGPDGGDGGRGGHILFIADKNLHTLQDFRYRRKNNAKDGEHGRGANKAGKNGEDLIIRVPCGTLIRDKEKNILADFINDGQQEIIATGGNGGRGNQHFASSTNQTPQRSEGGWPGEEKEIILELKLMADVGLVGKPNAGKSTLLSHLSSAKPKIADYPFTTLQPILGIVRIGDYQSFVLADIPGLIEGAHRGKGLGLQFLRHIERTKVLVYLIDLNDPDPKKTFTELKNELKCYNKELLKKKSLLVYNKIDLFQKPPKTPKGVIKISAVSGAGLDELKKKIFDLLQDNKKN